MERGGKLGWDVGLLNKMAENGAESDISCTALVPFSYSDNKVFSHELPERLFIFGEVSIKLQQRWKADGYGSI